MFQEISAEEQRLRRNGQEKTAPGAGRLLFRHRKRVYHPYTGILLLTGTIKKKHRKKFSGVLTTIIVHF